MNVTQEGFECTRTSTIISRDKYSFYYTVGIRIFWIDGYAGLDAFIMGSWDFNRCIAQILTSYNLENSYSGYKDENLIELYANLPWTAVDGLSN